MTMNSKSNDFSVARKSLGQHFLRDQKAISSIVKAVPQGVTAIEIGPGQGAITKHLLDRVGRLVVIEKDDRFAQYWQQHMAEFASLQVVHGDVMEELAQSIQTYQPQWIVGNLPYNISGPLTAELASYALLGGMVLMYQREVAERIVSEPGSKVYGGLSVLVRHYYDVKRLLTLPPGAFSPPPKVHSAVVVMSPHGRVPEIDFEWLQQTVRKGFAHRRKTIMNNFRGVFTEADFQQLDIDPRKRPEQLAYAAWAGLAQLIRDKQSAEA
ncbi:MAG: ribosomal RNA small subunit methyltransferase A [Zetaproteobacteria bacterium CG_4_9_14_3_um_filter_49_83]|nr:MAG: ribosomal RNA small subunit methyltransferase A [Zetaproteobacteria bacterium CG1_02_49_23]PIQ31773.1 MAG: ribosomal RNA small subunit methyltransferase A [Zetaproteobacteria bacterium CG17_big_fil_post_rev_8_21_14_2_50_50_13]PIV31410.1 MAG: ribosomal RNA small subunit methyltransferase A [Zetaproteobacteria bacterium CG02_land_8_20_14_3_00_50_9]PIY56644.1 MAG: ribosomal RNA small subunit methyltransferase A [Zetaproteobacteria bacterium CG_4_10_14_0_8_um_filter_49_80]PJA34199.1 MAG: ri